MVTKRKSKSKSATRTKARRSKENDNLASQRRKYNRGGRIEAYTFGEALGSKNWP